MSEKLKILQSFSLLTYMPVWNAAAVHNMCPATGTGKMLSPMDLIVKLRDHLTNYGAVVTSKQPWVPTFAFANTRGNQLALASAGKGAEESAAALIYSPSLIGDVITEEEIWACTTCRNCEDQCPVMNEHVEKIIDLRRYLTLNGREIGWGCQAGDDQHRAPGKSVGIEP